MLNNLPDEPMARLIAIMSLLRSKDGCPWDREQTPASLAPYLLEEAYEALAAINAGRPDDIKKELGDLLLQIVFLAKIFEEEDQFCFDDVANAICEKMIRRHPHVFGDSDEKDMDRLNRQWDSIKRSERQHRSDSLLASIPSNLPALLQAQKISDRVARAGFDWECPADVVDKLDEEVAEIREAIKNGDQKAIEDEFGDILFTIVNIGRHLGVDSEMSLLSMLQRFKTRFQNMEALLEADGRKIDDVDSDALNSYWCLVKEQLRENS